VPGSPAVSVALLGDRHPVSAEAELFRCHGRASSAIAKGLAPALALHDRV